MRRENYGSIRDSFELISFNVHGVHGFFCYSVCARFCFARRCPSRSSDHASYTELFMAKAVVYVKAFFPVFMLGAVFGKVMEDTLLAKGISHAIMEKLGHKHAVLAIVLSCAILTYGGVSLFVVVFAVYPFAAALFKEANIPKRLIPGCVA